MSEWKTILNNKQPGTVYEVKQYEHLYTRLASQECNLTFLKQCQKSKSIPDCLKIDRVCFPYIPGLTENVGRIITRTLGNPIGYIPYNRMSDIVTTHKDKNICPKCGVYKVSCTCGHIYIGETGREFETRLKEHKDQTRLGHTDKSAISNHFWDNIGDPIHTIEWEEAKIIVSEERFVQRTMIESLLIKKAKHEGIPLMNRKEEEGRDWIPNFWNSLFYDLLQIN